MPSVDERLRQVTLKVKRAKEHIADLEREQRAFLETNPYKVGAKHDPETRKLIYYVTGVEPTPDCLPLIVGDAIHNLMSALDHLAYQIVCSDTGDNPPNARRIYFPVADSAVEYEALKRRKIEGARQETMDAIDALKPYKGGNDLLWILYKLNNIEKHRLLLTVGSQAAGINVAQLMASHHPVQTSAFSEAQALEAQALLESMEVYMMPSDAGFPLQAGFELYIGFPDEEPNQKQKFRFAVALSEPGVIEGKPLLQTLHQFAALVEGIVAALRPRLS